MCWRLNVGVVAGLAVALFVAGSAHGRQDDLSDRAVQRSVTAVESRADKLEARMTRLARETAAVRERVAKVEARLPNQTRTFVFGLISGFAAAVLGHLVKWLTHAGGSRQQFLTRLMTVQSPNPDVRVSEPLTSTVRPQPSV